MSKNQFKGKILEKIIKYFLSKQGYKVIPDNLQDMYGIGRNGAGLTLKGRGAEHQIDALGQFLFHIPFVYPLRLLCESKGMSKPVGLEVIRNYVGVLKDISENYFVNKMYDLTEIPRFMDCASIFSTSGFTKEAQMYAFAQGIYLIELQILKPIIDKILSNYPEISQDELITKLDFLEGLDESEEDIRITKYLLNKKQIIFGQAQGIYPIVILSEKEIPKEKFNDTDNANVKIHYIKREEGKSIEFSIEFDSWIGKFQLPKYIWEKHLKSINYEEEMINLKEKKLGYIDIPLEINSLRRIIRLNLDKGWLESLRNQQD